MGEDARDDRIKPCGENQMAQSHVVIVFRKNITPLRMYAIADVIFKRLPTRICYQLYEKLDPDKSDEIAKTIGFCFKYPEATFSFAGGRDAVLAEELIEEYIKKQRDAYAAIERVSLV